MNSVEICFNNFFAAHWIFVQAQGKIHFVQAEGSSHVEKLW